MVESIGMPYEPAHEFYRESLNALHDCGVPFLVGGAFALEAYAGVVRRTKDLDVFVRPGHIDRLMHLLEDRGYQIELRFPHWLAKAFKGGQFIDIIFSSGNGVCTVDDAWFQHSHDAVVVGVPVKILPPEEMIWSKAFIMERERYDGADIAHLLRSRATTLDWPRLLHRFNGHWRVLFSHLVLFGFIYPAHRLQVPMWIMEELIRRLGHEMTSPSDSRLCQGTLLSWSQYLAHIQGGEYEDARHPPRGSLTLMETRHMTEILSREEKRAG